MIAYTAPNYRPSVQKLFTPWLGFFCSAGGLSATIGLSLGGSFAKTTFPEARHTQAPEGEKLQADLQADLQDRIAGELAVAYNENRGWIRDFYRLCR